MMIQIDRIYGNNLGGWKLFMRIRPGKMDMSSHAMHGTTGQPAGNDAVSTLKLFLVNGSRQLVLNRPPVA